MKVTGKKNERKYLKWFGRNKICGALKFENLLMLVLIPIILVSRIKFKVLKCYYH